MTKAATIRQMHHIRTFERHCEKVGGHTDCFLERKNPVRICERVIHQLYARDHYRANPTKDKYVWNLYQELKHKIETHQTLEMI